MFSEHEKNVGAAYCEIKIDTYVSLLDDLRLLSIY